MEKPLIASVLICTRNRAAYLGTTILQAASQYLSTGAFEIVVVDNGSTDGTAEVVRECQAHITMVSLRYVVEEDVGLSAARNRAIREARGQILCFLDDDAVPETKWLEWLVRGYDAHPGAMCVGGAVVPVYEVELPTWFPDEMEFIFKPRIQEAELHQVVYPYFPYGANFSIRAEAASYIGEFNCSLGYKGQNLIPCEETEFLLRVEKAGYKILMEPRAVVRHIIPANRLTRNYLQYRFYANGQGNALMNYFHDIESEKKYSMFSKCFRFSALFANKYRLCFKSWQQRTYNQNTSESCIFLKQCRLALDMGYSDKQWEIFTTGRHLSEWNHRDQTIHEKE